MKNENDINEKKACSIGIIGGADGPTAVFLSDSDENGKVKDKWQKTLEACEKLAVPREHAVTGDELKRHLIEKYTAQEVEASEGQKLALKISVLLNYYPDVLQQPVMPPKDAGRETLMKWANQKHADYWQSAQLVPDEKYGLRFSILKVPRISENEPFYDLRAKEIRDNIRKRQSLLSRLFRRHKEKPGWEMDDMEFLLELSTGYMQLSNGCKSLMDEIILWRGVTKEDIDNCTPVFMSYAAALRDTGKTCMENV